MGTVRKADEMRAKVMIFTGLGGITDIKACEISRAGPAG